MHLARIKFFGILLWAWPVLVIGWFFRPLLSGPNNYLFGTSGDALKNYFTFSYYVRYDSGLHFSGMNYPYGEHILFTDNQPFFALCTKLINTVIPIGDITPGILNTLMVLSLLLSIVFLYGIFRFLKVNPWLAMTGALLITLLSPQIARLTSHYSLSYGFFIPAMIYLVLRASAEPRKWKWLVWIFLTGFIAAFTHLYYLLMIGILLVGYAVLCMVLNRKAWRHALAVLAVSLVLGAVCLTLMQGTDPVSDRPANPWGVYYHHATAASMYLPAFEPHQKFAMDVFRIKQPDGEGRAYVGLVPILLLPLVLLFFVRRRREKAMLVLTCLFLAGFLEWVYATAWLYEIGLDKLWEVLPQLKQFRSLGRLTWPFYYVWAIAAAWSFFALLQWIGKKQSKLLAGAVGAVFLGFWAWESCTYVTQKTAGIFNENVLLSGGDGPYTKFLAEHDLAPDDVQCQIQLPFVAVGGEKYVIDDGVWAMRHAMQCAFETGIPIVNIYMSRTSVRQSLNAIQLFSDPLIPKERLRDFDQRPVLVLSEDRLLNPVERRFLQRAEKIGQLGQVTGYLLDIERLKTSVPDTAGDPALDTLVLDFSEQAFPSFMPGGSAIVDGTVPDTLCRFRADSLPGSRFEFSLWIRVDEVSPVFPILGHIRRNTAGTEERKTYSMFDLELFDVVGNWVRLELAFDAGMDTHIFTLERQGTIYDALLIRPAESNVRLADADGNLQLLNNYPAGEVLDRIQSME